MRGALGPTQADVQASLLSVRASPQIEKVASQRKTQSLRTHPLREELLRESRLRREDMVKEMVLDHIQLEKHQSKFSSRSMRHLE